MADLNSNFSFVVPPGVAATPYQYFIAQGKAFTDENLAAFPPAPPKAPRPNLDFRNMARLQSMPKSGYGSTAADSKVVIYLPHLPEEIELSRENQYQTTSDLVFTDGLWSYQSTSPLEIPLSFSLHAWDALCVEGSKSLLDIAARLHSLLLPVSANPVSNGKALPASNSANQSVSEELQVSSRIQNQPNLPQGNSGASLVNAPKFPPACQLRLIQAGARGLGLNCAGFVKSVKVILHGPFMSTVDDAIGFNLPSAATFSFVFVHNPFYTNEYWNLKKWVNAYGPDVFNYFYNTAHLTALSKNTYSEVDNLAIDRIAGWMK